MHSPSTTLPIRLTICLLVCIETCKRCGYMSSNDLCKACSLLEGLERGMSNAAIVRTFVHFVFLAFLSSLRRPTKAARS